MEVRGRYQSGEVTVSADVFVSNGISASGTPNAGSAPSVGMTLLLHHLEESRRILGGVVGSVSDELRRQRDQE